MAKRSSKVAIDSTSLIKDFQLPGGELVHVLTGVDLKIKKGEFIGVMGPSGSGKSTLLNILATLETITEGEVKIAGVNLHNTSYKDRLQIRRTKSSVVFQNFALIPYLTAKENVKLPMKLRGVIETEAESKAIDFLEIVGLFARIDHLPEELSGGEQQRVAIARALAHEPDIIYADEPTGNLDTHTGKDIIALFKNLAKEQKITIIMVTHDTLSARETDRLYILQKGKVLKEQTKILDSKYEGKKEVKK
ncbi:MAG: ABC transporter ATP-binding protein [Candidatus Heimdallarchaeota archaeon]|nr:ABC transporter ATP-binding protein [Candidatus Heimdallarchaeota archaeon]